MIPPPEVRGAKDIPAWEMETLWARLAEAFRLATLAGHAEVTFELRDAATLIMLAEGD